MTEIETFRLKIEEFLLANCMSPTQFGKQFARDPLFVFQLRQGREPRTDMRQKILRAMDERCAA